MSMRICAACSTNCALCTAASPTKCQLCYEGYWLDPTAQTCSADMCDDSGYCVYCNSSTTCGECYEGSYMDPATLTCAG